jgi:hypothetical protein
MRLRSHYGQLTEVRIKGENNLASVLCMGQDGGIARIRRPIDDALDVVSGFGERGRNRPRHTTVDQNLHAPGL